MLSSTHVSPHFSVYIPTFVYNIIVVYIYICLPCLCKHTYLLHHCLPKMQIPFVIVNISKTREYIGQAYESCNYWGGWVEVKLVSYSKQQESHLRTIHTMLIVASSMIHFTDDSYWGASAPLAPFLCHWYNIGI